MYNAIYFYSTASGGSSTQNRFFGYTQKSAEKFLLFLAYLMILQSFSLPQACFTLKYQVFQIGKSEKKSRVHHYLYSRFVGKCECKHFIHSSQEFVQSISPVISGGLNTYLVFFSKYIFSISILIYIFKILCLQLKKYFSKVIHYILVSF